jgi:hypothetical protein
MLSRLDPNAEVTLTSAEMAETCPEILTVVDRASDERRGLLRSMRWPRAAASCRDQSCVRAETDQPVSAADRARCQHENDPSALNQVRRLPGPYRPFRSV